MPKNVIALGGNALGDNPEEQNELVKISAAEVVILYDLIGNIINPGVKLSESKELLTTNDAIYDSESIILDNILRTKIIGNDPCKVFYLKDDNKTYTLLDNKQIISENEPFIKK